MEKSRKNKKIILIVLVLVVVGLSIGFAAFGSQLTINSSASVTMDGSTFKVGFSDSQSGLTGTTTTSTKVGTGVTAAEGKFENNNLTISGLSASFTGPGQSVTWKAYAYNDGQFDAFLKSVTVGKITCVADSESGTTQAYVDEAAKGISIKVSVGGDVYPTTNANITNSKLEIGKAKEVLITLEYADGSAIADGDFDVQIEPIQLNYSSVD